MDSLSSYPGSRFPDYQVANVLCGRNHRAERVQRLPVRSQYGSLQLGAVHSYRLLHLAGLGDLQGEAVVPRIAGRLFYSMLLLPL